MHLRRHKTAPPAVFFAVAVVLALSGGADPVAGAAILRVQVAGAVASERQSVAEIFGCVTDATRELHGHGKASLPAHPSFNLIPVLASRPIVPRDAHFAPPLERVVETLIDLPPPAL